MMFWRARRCAGVALRRRAERREGVTTGCEGDGRAVAQSARKAGEADMGESVCVCVEGEEKEKETEERRIIGLHVYAFVGG